MNSHQAGGTNLKQNPEAWVDRYGDYLYHFALSRVHNPTVAEDLVQETFLSALRSLKDFKGRSSEKTWLAGILKHKIGDHFRKSVREQPVEDLQTDTESIDAFFDQKGNW